MHHFNQAAFTISCSIFIRVDVEAAAEEGGEVLLVVGPEQEAQ